MATLLFLLFFILLLVAGGIVGVRPIHRRIRGRHVVVGTLHIPLPLIVWGGTALLIAVVFFPTLIVGPLLLALLAVKLGLFVLFGLVVWEVLRRLGVGLPASPLARAFATASPSAAPSAAAGEPLNPTAG
jgi:hypothetical protein